MRCPYCQAENRLGARFCGRCGEALEVQSEPVHATAVGAGRDRAAEATEVAGGASARDSGTHPALAGSPAACPTCGSPLKPGARFCGRCGSVVATAAEHTGSAEAGHPEADPVLPVGMPSSPTVRESPQQTFAADSVPSTQGPPRRDVGPVVVPYARPAMPAGSGPADSQKTTAVRTASAVGAGRNRAAGSRRATGRPAWLVAAVTAVVSGACFFCIVAALAVGPAFGGSVPSLAPEDLTRPDLTILVEEAYISDMVSAALPDAIDGDAMLDVQPGNLIVTTIDFQLLIVRLQVVVNSRIAVEGGRIGVGVESIETGGRNLLDLIGMDQLVLGEDITGAIQDVLEDELGEGVRLLAVSTDETRVILTARWE